MWVSQFVMIVIAIAHVLAVQAPIATGVAPGLVQQSEISFAVSVINTLASEFVLSWLQMLPLWHRPLEFWSFWPLLSPGYFERLWVLLYDLCPFAIEYTVCLAGLHWVSPLWSTRNQWLITFYYMVHFNLPSPETLVSVLKAKPIVFNPVSVIWSMWKSGDFQQYFKKIILAT